MTVNGVVANTVPPRVGEGDLINWRGLRDGSAVVVPWYQALVLEGRGFSLQFGDEDAPVASTGNIDDQLAIALVDVRSGTTAIPFWAQGVVGTWTTSTLVNFMVEIDTAAVRYASGGVSGGYTPLNLRTDSPISSTTPNCFVAAGDVVPTARVAGNQIELYRESIEVNVGDVADYWPPMEYRPTVPPMVVGPGSIIVHFGAAADMTVYGSLHWLEIPSTSIGATR